MTDFTEDDDCQMELINLAIDFNVENLFNSSAFPFGRVIVSYLHPEDYFNCLQVCQKWKVDLNQNYYFKRVKIRIWRCILEMLHESKSSPDITRKWIWLKKESELSQLKLDLYVRLAIFLRKNLPLCPPYPADKEEHEVIRQFLLKPSPDNVPRIAGMRGNFPFFKTSFRILKKLKKKLKGDDDKGWDFVDFLSKALCEGLDCAVMFKHDWILEKLTVEDLMNTDILKWAIVANNVDVVSILIQKLPAKALLNIDRRGKNETALIWANRVTRQRKAKNERLQSLERRRLGVDDVISDLRMVKLIIEKMPPEGLTYTDERGESPLYQAAVLKQDEIVDLIIAKMPSTDLLYEEPAVFLAIWNHHAGVARNLLEKFPENYLDEEGSSVLHAAMGHPFLSRTGHPDWNMNQQLMQFLVSKLSCDQLMEENCDGDSPLHWAAWNSRDEIVQLLCDKLSLENLMAGNSMHGDTALHLAVWQKHLPTVEILVKILPKEGLAKANRFGKTPLEFASKTSKIYQLIYNALRQ